MMTNISDFAEFRADMLAAGYDEVIERIWEPGVVNAVHSHPFEAEALIVAGEMRLRIGAGELQCLRRGDRFHLAANEAHEERYGDVGAVYWVARKSRP